MNEELNQEQNYTLEQIHQLYSEKEWWTNPIIRTKKAIIDNEEMSLKILKREAILLGPINIQLDILSVKNELVNPHHVILSNYIHYDLNNITRFIIEVDLLKSDYKILYSSEPLYEYGYEEEYLDSLSAVVVANSFKEAKQYYQNTLTQLSVHIKSDKLIKKISKSIDNYFNLIKDKRVSSTRNMVSDDDENKNNNTKSLEYFAAKFEKENLEKLVSYQVKNNKQKI